MNNAPKPLLIAIGGLSGSGKTTLAASLAAQISNTVHFDSDRIRKEICGVAPRDRLPVEGYAPEVKVRANAEMSRRIIEALQAGKNVVVSETFVAADWRAAQEKMAAENGAGFKGLWLNADLSTLFDRVAKRVNDISDATPDIVKMQAGKDTGPIAWTVIDAMQPKEQVLRIALAILNPHRQVRRARNLHP